MDYDGLCIPKYNGMQIRGNNNHDYILYQNDPVLYKKYNATVTIIIQGVEETISLYDFHQHFLMLDENRIAKTDEYTFVKIEENGNIHKIEDNFEDDETCIIEIKENLLR